MANKTKEEKKKEKEERKRKNDEKKRERNQKKAEKKKEKEKNGKKPSKLEKEFFKLKKKTADSIKDAREKLKKINKKDLGKLATGILTNAFASKLGGMLGQVPAMGVIMQLTSMAMVVDSVTNIMDSLNETFNKTTDDKYVEKKQSRTNEATTNSNLGSQLNLIPEPLKLSDDSGKAELSSAVSEKKSSSSSSSSGAQASSVGAFSGTVKKDKNKEESSNKIGKNDYKNAVAMR